MKRTVFILLFTCFCIGAIQAQDYRWELSFSVFPNLYWKYNREEFNVPYIKPIAPSYPIGVALGFGLHRRFNTRWGFYTGLEYNSQIQKYKSTSYGDIYEGNTYYFNQDVELKIEYVSLPIQVVYTFPLDKNKNWIMYCKQGLQLSYLVDYYSELNVFTQSIPNGDFDVLRETKIYDYYGKYNYIIHDFDYNSYYTLPTAYKEFVLGYSGALGVKRSLSNRVILQVGLRSDYDITNIDNVEGFKSAGTAGMRRYVDGESTASSAGRPASHNIRVGLEMGIVYKVD